MYQALYRKYRPKTFADVVGQNHITQTLKNQLKSGKIFHAYLFTGTRGTGKTTCAKILAAAVNCHNTIDGDPCGECEACRLTGEGLATDIIEMDAASNNGVDYIRDLKEQVSFLPVALKYRVYIIDEVHMLSDSAFNALLKTLEEPPAHVIFILATTEVHKLPATILSRCQRYDFRRIEPEILCQRMMEIADKENFTLTPEAATLIAGLADGGMRDALSILDQCAGCSNEITEQLVTEICGMAGNAPLNELIGAIAEQKAERALEIVDQLYRASVDMKNLCAQLITCFRNMMIIKTVKDSRRLIVCSTEQFSALSSLAEKFSLSDILSHISALQASAEKMGLSSRRSELELAIIKLCTPAVSGSIEALEKRVAALERQLDGTNADVKPAKPAKLKPDPQPVLTLDPETPASPVEEEPRQDKNPAENTESLEDTPQRVTQWPEILEIISKTCPPIYGFLHNSKAYVSGKLLLIDSANSQFKEIMNANPKYRDCIREAAKQVLGQTYQLGPYKQQPPKNEVDPLVEFAKLLN